LSDDTRHIEVDSPVEVRNLAKREMDMRIMPWGVTIQTVNGPEVFERGAFDDVDPTKVMLQGLDHEASIGIGQNGGPIITRHPVGRGKAEGWRNEPDGQYLTTRVAGTARGDEILALTSDGIVQGVSVEFSEVPGGTVTEMRGGRRTRVHKRVRLTGIAPTYRPAYEDALVLAVRSDAEGDTPVAESPEIVPVQPDLTPQFDELKALVRGTAGDFNTRMEGFAQQLLQVQETQRQDIDIPASPTEVRSQFHQGQWMSYVVRMFAGDRISDQEMRLVADLITTDNIGVVPPAYLDELIGIIDPRRPFLATTRRIPTPDSGMTINLPKLVTRPTVATQAAEKDELSSTATAITTEDFSAVTKGGVGDLSLQLIKRSSPSFLSLYLELLAEAYALNTEDSAVDALLAEAAVVEGGTLDPNDLSLGAAWTNSTAATRRGPDHIWLSSSAVAAFLNAKADGTNLPMYGDLRADFSVPGGVGGSIMGLRPVWVPALDDEAVDVIVGPSTGFLWAEDGTYTLQVDVPSKAGRDVAIVGMIWYMPIYPAAFTSYTIAS
jgi:phage head maturation protease